MIDPVFLLVFWAHMPVDRSTVHVDFAGQWFSVALFQ